MKIIGQFFQQCLIYGLVFLIGLPISFLIMMAGAKRAQASERQITPVVSKIIIEENSPGTTDLVFGLPGAVSPLSQVEVAIMRDFSEIIGVAQSSSDGSFETIPLGDNLAPEFVLRTVSKTAASAKITLENDVLPPVLEKTTPLKRETTYFQGEPIVFHPHLGERKLSVWAEIGRLDAAFPWKISLEYLDDGIWNLTTPALTENLNEGLKVIRLFAQDQAGNTLIHDYLVTLRKLAAPKIISFLVDPRNLVDITWQKVPNTKQYLLEWRNEKTGEIFQKKVDNDSTSARIRDLEPGTWYEIKVTAISLSDEMASQDKVMIKTLGAAAEEGVQQIAGVQESASIVPKTTEKRISPAIGEGVATGPPKIAQKPQAPAEVKPQESPTPTLSPNEEEKQQAGGWSKVLVALSILVIAAGAAIGGYYGYEWWTKSQDKEKEKEPPSSSSRW